ncbi:MAG: hypothetical protein JXN62_09940 [Bacteroidales bacterium]|nr:hypothetical protein [Bacteroidales bacterium]
MDLLLKAEDQNILSGKSYTKPEVTRIVLDNSISLVMMTTIPDNPVPRDRPGKGEDYPFESPFGDKPFS